MQVADAHRTALDRVQACVGQQFNQVVEIDITVVMKMIKKPLLSLFRPCKINGQHSSSWLQNSSHFVSTLLASLAAKMMKHDRGQYRIELTVGKRQSLDDAILEHHLRASLLGLLTRPGQHFRRSVNSVDFACRADAPLRGDRECASPAAYIQDLRKEVSNGLKEKENLAPRARFELGPFRLTATRITYE